MKKSYPLSDSLQPETDWLIFFLNFGNLKFYEQEVLDSLRTLRSTLRGTVDADHPRQFRAARGRRPCNEKPRRRFAQEHGGYRTGDGSQRCDGDTGLLEIRGAADIEIRFPVICGRGSWTHASGLWPAALRRGSHHLCSHRSYCGFCRLRDRAGGRIAYSSLGENRPRLPLDRRQERPDIPAQGWNRYRRRPSLRPVGEPPSLVDRQLL